MADIRLLLLWVRALTDIPYSYVLRPLGREASDPANVEFLCASFLPTVHSGESFEGEIGHSGSNPGVWNQPPRNGWPRRLLTARPVFFRVL